YNRIVDNEVYDWGDGIALAAGSTCDVPGNPHGSVIDGNDVYITGAKRISCVDGGADPNGDCSCSENGIDVKPDPGPDPALWTRITNNRVWGFRPLRQPSYCGGQGAYGQAITAGNSCAGHVLVAGNVVLDSTVGVAIGGSNWIVTGNLFHEIRTSTVDRPVVPVAVFEEGGASNLRIEFNTIVGVDNAYDDQSANTDTRCNAVVDDVNVDWYLGPRGANHLTEHNFLYHVERPWANFFGPTNETFPAAGASGNGQFCFPRKRLTGPETVCVPYARTTPASPHAMEDTSCDPDLLAPFGLAPISYGSIQAVPEPDLRAMASAVLLAFDAWARRARGSSSSRARR
ncbi:MAG: hypothetical protein L0206_03985, partial [Actinobacteria bacterium]|nr:hypothetical protein [Actinomycetota bacterium]